MLASFVLYTGHLPGGFLLLGGRAPDNGRVVDFEGSVRLPGDVQPISQGEINSDAAGNGRNERRRRCWSWVCATGRAGMREGGEDDKEQRDERRGARCDGPCRGRDPFR